MAGFNVCLCLLCGCDYIFWFAVHQIIITNHYYVIISNMKHLAKQVILLTLLW